MPEPAAIWAIRVSLGSAIMLAATGVGLAVAYRPDPFAVEPTGTTEWLSALQLASAALLLVSAIVGFLVMLSTRLSRRRTGQRSRVALVASAIGVVSAITVALTQALVQWDQLALRSVSVGSGLDGYFTAAFDDEVKFVLVDGIEVTQGSYGFALALHLAVPLLAIGALALAARELRRPTGPSPAG